MGIHCYNYKIVHVCWLMYCTLQYTIALLFLVGSGPNKTAVLQHNT